MKPLDQPVPDDAHQPSHRNVLLVAQVEEIRAMTSRHDQRMPVRDREPISEIHGDARP
jgi:hypothetical protein